MPRFITEVVSLKILELSAALWNGAVQRLLPAGTQQNRRAASELRSD